MLMVMMTRNFGVRIYESPEFIVPQPVANSSGHVKPNVGLVQWNKKNNLKNMTSFKGFWPSQSSDFLIVLLGQPTQTTWVSDRWPQSASAISWGYPGKKAMWRWLGESQVLPWTSFVSVVSCWPSLIWMHDLIVMWLRTYMWQCSVFDRIPFRWRQKVDNYSLPWQIHLLKNPPATEVQKTTSHRSEFADFKNTCQWFQEET